MGKMVFYPSSWYFNACVQGLLLVLEQAIGHKTIEQQFLPDDGTLVISDEWLEALLDPEYKGPKQVAKVPEDLTGIKPIAWWWVEATSTTRKPEEWISLSTPERLNKITSSYFVGNKGLYVNLVQSRDDKEDFLNRWFVTNPPIDTGLNCSFCGHPFAPDKEDKSYYEFFTSALSSLASSSPAGFPNLFYNGTPGLPICKQCRWPLICFHLTHRNGMFINTGSFQLNWHLNKYLSSTKHSSNYRYRPMMDMLFQDPRLRTAVGSWQLQGIEVYTFGRSGGDSVNRYLISDNVARLLLLPVVAEPLRNLSNQSSHVLDALFTEQYGRFSGMLYHTLRQLSGGSGLKELLLEKSEVWPVIQLYAAILRAQGRSDEMEIKSVYKWGEQAPLSLDENTDKNLILRLLELTRNNQQTEAYHLLLRKYLTEKEPFPLELVTVFSAQDPEAFKTGIFSYVAGVSSRTKNNEG